MKVKYSLILIITSMLVGLGIYGAVFYASKEVSVNEIATVAKNVDMNKVSKIIVDAKDVNLQLTSTSKDSYYMVKSKNKDNINVDFEQKGNVLYLVVNVNGKYNANDIVSVFISNKRFNDIKSSAKNTKVYNINTLTNNASKGWINITKINMDFDLMQKDFSSFSYSNLLNSRTSNNNTTELLNIEGVNASNINIETSTAKLNLIDVYGKNIHITNNEDYIKYKNKEIRKADDVYINTHSGSINIHNVVGNKMNLLSTTGNIFVNNDRKQNVNSFTVQSMSGHVESENIKAKSEDIYQK